MSKYRLVAYFPNRNPTQGEEERYIIDQKEDKVELCGSHNLDVCKFVIETEKNGEYVPIENVSNSFDNFYSTLKTLIKDREIAITMQDGTTLDIVSCELDCHNKIFLDPDYECKREVLKLQIENLLAELEYRKLELKQLEKNTNPAVKDVISKIRNSVIVLYNEDTEEGLSTEERKENETLDYILDRIDEVSK